MSVGPVGWIRVPGGAGRCWCESDPRLGRAPLAYESGSGPGSRDRLGWTSSPTDEEMFTTDHDLEEKDASFTTIKRGQTVGSFDLSLTSRIPKDVMDEAVPITGRAFNAYVEALTAVYGQGKRGKRKQHASVTWTLPSDASVRIGTVGWVIGADIDSPAGNEAARGEAQYFAEIADENDPAR